MAARVDIELAPHPLSAGQAREAVDGLAYDLDPAVRTRLRLVVSELVANAVRHGEGPVRLVLERRDGVIRGHVADDGPGFEHELRRASPDDLGGRGLPLVAALSTRWGVFDGSSHVWFELPEGRIEPARAEPELGPPDPGVLPDAD